MATRAKAQLPVNYEEQLAQEAAAIAKRIASPSGDRVRFDGKFFVLPTGERGDKIEAVVIDFNSSNLFYEGAYDRDNPQPPTCFAIGSEPMGLVPSSNSPDRQADTCALCPKNQFKSAGKGKACKNTRLVAFAGLPLDGEEQPLQIMSIPPTSLKAFDTYVSSLASKNKTVPIAMLTEISMDPTTTYASPRFRAIRPLTSTELAAFMPRREEANTRLNAEPDVSMYGAVPDSPAKTAPTRAGQTKRK